MSFMGGSGSEWSELSGEGVGFFRSVAQAIADPSNVPSFNVHFPHPPIKKDRTKERTAFMGGSGSEWSELSGEGVGFFRFVASQRQSLTCLVPQASTVHFPHPPIKKDRTKERTSFMGGSGSEWSELSGEGVGFFRFVAQAIAGLKAEPFVGIARSVDRLL